jgi:hypothetical protein
VIRPENFIYFFTVCGFFIGLIFSVINFMDPANILLYTAEITLFFYLFIHVVIMNFVDIKKFGTEIFNKKEYEEVSEYFISELDVREKKMDGLLLSIEKMNERYEKIVKGTVSQDGANQKKAA